MIDSRTLSALSVFALAAAFFSSANAATGTDSKLTPMQGGRVSPAPAPILPPSGETWTMPKIAEQPQWGANIQRSMKLMATSTRSKRNRVRVLFYGQSITEQTWSKMVADDLRRRFPHTDFDIRNLAIGGFVSQLLLKTAEQDLYPFYPDLMIFYVYGSHIDYDKIIENTRRRTTADIVLQTDHPSGAGDLTEETDPSRLSPANWGPWWNHVFLPETARKYNAELVDQRSAWKNYLKAEKLEPKLFLADDVHLNGRGNALMATLVSPYLRYDPKLPVTTASSVRDYAIGKNLKWNKGRIKMTFSGNRIDVIADEMSKKAGAPIRVLVDGKAPSKIMGTTAFTRSSVGHATWGPAIMRFDSQAVLVPENWTAKITEISDDGKKFKYSVRGSVTGDDGIGDSEKIFVSDSERVVIDPKDWWLGFSSAPMPVGFEVTWKSVPQYIDTYTSPKIVDQASEYSTTLAQGFANTTHTLELIVSGKNPPNIKTIRVYEPSLK